jgi:DNA-directed RNA polymerase specialized sigma24 family protein
MNGRASPYYGQLQTASLPSEVKRIWYSRDEELEPLPSWRWSFEMQTDMEQVEQRELVIKLLETICFTDREDLVVRLIVMDGCTLDEIAQELDVTSERVRQIYMKAMRKARTRQKSVTGEDVWHMDCEVTTWQHYSWQQRQSRRSAGA